MILSNSRAIILATFKSEKKESIVATLILQKIYNSNYF